MRYRHVSSHPCVGCMSNMSTASVMKRSMISDETNDEIVYWLIRQAPDKI